MTTDSSILSFDKPAGVLVKTTLVDFPGIVAGSFFLRGCNLRCPYCYNRGLVENTDSTESFNTINELFSHLEKRKGLLHGLVISGGEPLLNPYTPVIIKKAKSLGYKIKLDTNGTLPSELEFFISNPELHPDFIAMDIKTSPYKYASMLCNPASKFFCKDEYFEKVLKKSIELISNYPADQREFRTVLVPLLLQKEDIETIGKMIPEDSSWQFAQFRNENCLNPDYNKINPYSDKEIKELIDFAKSFVKGAELR